MSSHPRGLLKIVYEDEEILVVEKPAGMPSTLQGSAEEWLQKKFPTARLVHRLDNNTSGLMIAAKTEEAYEKLRAIWKTPQVTKKYTALVLGKTLPQGIITTPIAHHPRKKKKMSVGGKKARPAQTHYRTLNHFKNYSLVEIEMTTGVRHQIRAHMASIGHRVAGDKLYQKSSHKIEDGLNLTRHFLHLSHLKLPHPTTQKILEWSSKLPKELELCVKSLTVQ